MALFSLIIYLYIMFTAIITIFVVYFLWLVAKPWLARYMRRKMQQKVNDMFRQTFGGAQARDFPFGAQSEPRQQQSRQRQEPPRGPRRKIFSRDEGEYIDFEEVTVRTGDPASSQASATDKRAYTPREPQISDAEWEEV